MTSIARQQSRQGFGGVSHWRRTFDFFPFPNTTSKLFECAGIMLALIILAYFSGNFRTHNGLENFSRMEASSWIDYVLVEDADYHGTRFLRYAANEITSDQNDGTSIASHKKRNLTVLRWAELLSGDNGHHHAIQLTRLIQECHFDAVFFETKGVSPQTAKTKQFEFVLVDAPELHRFGEQSPDPDAFAQQLGGLGADSAGAAFYNLGGDALLIAPRKMQQRSDVTYSHLSAFLRGASQAQSTEIWKMVATNYGNIIQEQISNNHNDLEKPVWLSTSGLGIAWLHFRLDSRPKYYQYRPFADET